MQMTPTNHPELPIPKVFSLDLAGRSQRQLSRRIFWQIIDDTIDTKAYIDQRD